MKKAFRPFAVCLLPFLFIAAWPLRASEISVTMTAFSLPNAEVLPFLQKNNPMGNSDMALSTLEETAQKLGEITATISSGHHGVAKAKNIVLEIEPTLSPDGKTASVMAELSIDSSHVIGQFFSGVNRYSFFGVGADGKDRTCIVIALTKVIP